MHQSYIQQDKFFSNDNFAGKLMISLEVLESFEGSLADYNYFFKVPVKNQLRNEIAQNLEINILDYAAKTISITYKHSNPMYAQDVCNQIAQSYIEYDLTKKAISSVKIVEFINAQKDSVDVRLKIVNEKFSCLKKKIMLNPLTYLKNLISLN